MSVQEIMKKIEQAEEAIAKTESWKCRRDLQKYIRRLRRELRKRGLNNDNTYKARAAV